MADGVIGNTSDSESEKSRFETWSASQEMPGYREALDDRTTNPMRPGCAEDATSPLAVVGQLVDRLPSKQDATGFESPLRLQLLQ